MKNTRNHLLGNYNLAIAYKTRGNFEKTIEHFQRLIEDNPNHVAANFYLGLTYLDINDVDNALKMFKKVKELDPNHIDAANKIELLTK